MKKILIALTIILAAACTQTPARQPLENSVVYEMNVRQYTPEGTFAAAQKQLPRLKELGVDKYYCGHENVRHEKTGAAVIRRLWRSQGQKVASQSSVWLKRRSWVFSFVLGIVLPSGPIFTVSWLPTQL